MSPQKGGPNKKKNLNAHSCHTLSCTILRSSTLNFVSSLGLSTADACNPCLDHDEAHFLPAHIFWFLMRRNKFQRVRKATNSDTIFFQPKSQVALDRRKNLPRLTNLKCWRHLQRQNIAI